MNSQGFELNAGLKQEKFTIKCGYSYYENILKPGALPEVLNPETKSFLAIPQHKVTTLLGIEINSWLSWSATAVYQSGYRAYEPDENGENGMTLTSFAPSCLVNSFIHFQHIDFPFSGRIGASNILNSTYKIASPYNNGVASMQMDQRQIRLDLIYRITK